MTSLLLRSTTMVAVNLTGIEETILIGVAIFVVLLLVLSAHRRRQY
jgi:hypothetical protein